MRIMQLQYPGPLSGIAHAICLTITALMCVGCSQEPQIEPGMQVESKAQADSKAQAESKAQVKTEQVTTKVHKDEEEEEAVLRIIFLGDSLSAGYGVSPEEAFPSLIERKFLHSEIKVKVINAGVSGDTTAGGLNRMDWILAQSPDILVIELGANDGMRGLTLTHTKSNLKSMIDKAKKLDIHVLLLGMQIPSNYGQDYTMDFQKIYRTLAEETKIAFVADFLHGVGGVEKYNQADGIHPTTEGHTILAKNVYPTLSELVASVKEHE